MTVKYAHSEKEVIVAHNQKDSMEKKMKESLKERDVMMEKIKAMNNEKSRVCNMLEVKVYKMIGVLSKYGLLNSYLYLFPYSPTSILPRNERSID